MANVVGDAESLIVDPHGMIFVRHVGEALAEAGNELELRLDRAPDAIDVHPALGVAQWTRRDDPLAAALPARSSGAATARSRGRKCASRRSAARSGGGRDAPRPRCSLTRRTRRRRKRCAGESAPSSNVPEKEASWRNDLRER